MSPKLRRTSDTVTSSSSQKLWRSSVAKRRAPPRAVRAATDSPTDGALRRTAGDAGDPSKHSRPEALLQPFDPLLELRDVLLQPRQIYLPHCRALHGIACVVHDVRHTEGERRLTVADRQQCVLQARVL